MHDMKIQKLSLNEALQVHGEVTLSKSLIATLNEVGQLSIILCPTEHRFVV